MSIITPPKPNFENISHVFDAARSLHDGGKTDKAVEILLDLSHEIQKNFGKNKTR